ncbi:MAG: chemotaxis protein CheB [Trueperaceae bacterium]
MKTGKEGTRQEGTGRAFPIVGIGASAGGLEAAKAFFKNMPADSGMAFVVVQHLDPKHESVLAELLQNQTKMSVTQISGDTVVESDHVYVIPPNKHLTIESGTLNLSEREQPAGRPVVVDQFFCSLAGDQGESAVGIVLSGTGSEGTQGLKAIKAHGGITLAQDEAEAEHSGMPHSAIASGCVDLVLPVSKMPGKLLELKGRSTHLELPADRATHEEGEAETLRQIFGQIHRKTGHDFSEYKRSTVFRRLGRRMQLQGVDRLGDYLGHLRAEPAEAEALVREFLISVTHFFRDQEAFAALEHEAIPKLLADKGPGETVRVWVPGCASGEEAYSLAILLTEACAKLDQPPQLQLFATDIDEAALRTGRRGQYPTAIASELSAERLERYFVRENSGYRVQQGLREMVLFTSHNLLRDPPFAKLDLVSCRNLLIYLNEEVQRKVFAIFQYALKLDGYLLLGVSESPGKAVEKFAEVDRKAKLFRRRPGASEVMSFPISSPMRTGPAANQAKEIAGKGTSVGELAQRLLLKRYAPPSVVVDDSYTIVYVTGRIGTYLELAQGEPTREIFELARDGLRLDLRTALHQAKRLGEAVTRRAQVGTNGGVKAVNLTADPVADSGGMLLVTFEDVEAATERETDASDARPAAGKRRRPSKNDGASAIEELEAELTGTKKSMNETIDELETATSELRASNEEMQSINEELQTTGEELETSKEELQSSNEELTTVNQELRIKIAEASEANSVLNNLINSTDVATLFLDGELRLRRYTPRATELFHLIPGDIGRPLAHVAQRFHEVELLRGAQEVNESHNNLEREIVSKTGDWFLTRILPYHTVDDGIDGVVITLAEITERKHAEERTETARAHAQGILDTMREPLAVLDGDLRVVSASGAFYRTFQVSPEQTEGKFIYELGSGQWDIPELRKLLSTVLPKSSTVEDYEVRHDFPDIGPRILMLNARRLYQEGGHTETILLAFEDVTESRQEERLLLEAKEVLEQRVRERTADLQALNAELESFNYSVSHDLRTPLRGLDGFSQVLLEDYGDKLGEEGKHYLERIRNGADRMGNLIDDLLELSRLTHARMKPQEVDLSELARAVVEDLREREPNRAVTVDIDDDMTAYGDKDLLRIVLVNLLQNAWKFTGDPEESREEARVEVRMRRQDGQSVFVLRDNGIGFDMRYGDKMFAPFQRLHQSKKFDGTGIGLATVQRIVHKHGGRVWADGEPGKGASFYFTLSGETIGGETIGGETVSGEKTSRGTSSGGETMSGETVSGETVSGETVSGETVSGEGERA